MKHLGIALIPEKTVVDQIQILAEALEETGQFSFVCKSGISIPHCTLFQGQFANVEAVIKKISTVKIPKNLWGRLTSMEVWKSYLFLNLECTNELQHLHQACLSSVLDLAAKPSTYEFKPHITVASPLDPKNTPQMDLKMEDFRFSQLVVCSVGPHGSCQDLLWTTSL